MSKKSKKSKSIEPSVEEIYQKKTHHEHILSLPDTYIGSIEPDKQFMWIYDDDTNKIIKKEIIYILFLTIIKGLLFQALILFYT